MSALSSAPAGRLAASKRSTRAPRSRAAALVVRAEKVVGIDLGTTNSAVRPSGKPFRATA